MAEVLKTASQSFPNKTSTHQAIQKTQECTKPKQKRLKFDILTTSIFYIAVELGQGKTKKRKIKG
jgi:hypothetical protein